MVLLVYLSKPCSMSITHFEYFNIFGALVIIGECSKSVF